MDNLDDDCPIQKSQEACIYQMTTTIPPQVEEKNFQSNIFKVHFKRKCNMDGTYDVDVGQIIIP